MYTLLNDTNVFIPTAPVWVYNLIRDQSVLRIADLMPGTDGTVVINQFTRFHWEVPCNDYWLGYSKGGGFKRWIGLDFWVIDWTGEGGSIRDYALEKYPPTKLRLVIKDEHMARRQGLTYTSFANFNLGARELRSQHVSSNRGPCFVSNDSKICHRVLAFLNTHVANVLIRIICPSIEFGFKYVSEMPIAKRIAESNEIESLSNICLDISRQIAISDCRERYFDVAKFNSNANDCATLSENYTLTHFNLLKKNSILHSTEAIIELIVSRLLGLADADMEDVFSQTGKPVGLYPMLVGYDKCPEFRLSKYHITTSLLLFLESAFRQEYTPQELVAIKIRLNRIYQGGPGTNDIEESEALLKKNKSHDDAGETIAIAPFLTIPSQTFVEELSQKLQIHPISIYLLLEEMLEKEGLVCPSEQKRYAEDYASIMILRMLGYQWPKQVEAGEPLPEWADDDGIIPLIEGLGEPTFLDRVRKQIGADFGEEKEASIEAEFSNIVGKSLERWLEEDFFVRHVKQFKKRPIAWHIVSDPSSVNHEAGQGGKGKKKRGKKKQKPAFSVMIHYHRFVDGHKGYSKLLLLKNKYLEKLIVRTRSELESLRGKGDDSEAFDRMAELDRKLMELEDFREGRIANHEYLSAGKIRMNNPGAGDRISTMA